MKLVRELMHSPVVTIAPGETLRKALRLMNEHHIRQLPVAADGRLVGILTDRDIRLHVIYMEDRYESADSFNDALETPVDGVMTRDVKVLRPDQTLDDALNLFILEKFGGVPVVEAEDELVGILTYVDLLVELRRILGRE
jgi:acetoin utilization protein AcuB